MRSGCAEIQAEEKKIEARRRLVQWWVGPTKMVKRLFTCVNVERPRSSGNSKKSNLNRLTSNDEAI